MAFLCVVGSRPHCDSSLSTSVTTLITVYMPLTFILFFFHCQYLVSVPLRMFRVWAFLGMLGQVGTYTYCRLLTTYEVSNSLTQTCMRHASVWILKLSWFHQGFLKLYVMLNFSLVLSIVSGATCFRDIQILEWPPI